MSTSNETYTTKANPKQNKKKKMDLMKRPIPLLAPFLFKREKYMAEHHIVTVLRFWHKSFWADVEIINKISFIPVILRYKKCSSFKLGQIPPFVSALLKVALTL